MFFCSKFSVHAWISLLNWLGSVNWLLSTVLSSLLCTSQSTLVKVSLPWVDVSTWVSLRSLSGDGIASLLDLLFLLFPILLKWKSYFSCWGRIWIYSRESSKKQFRKKLKRLHTTKLVWNVSTCFVGEVRTRMNGHFNYIFSKQYKKDDNRFFWYHCLNN